ncbi:MAG: hypothetical protein PHQ54_01585 [Candidatus Omnitrophica bacterium]|nr:hypothetical protein [Candidatus Omnitrophota bacterium]
MSNKILRELRSHAPFTVFGAVLGIFLMFFFKNLPSKVSFNIFYILHPGHVFLSALVSASMYGLYKCDRSRFKCNIFTLLIVGYAGSVGIATISDSLIPYIGEAWLDMPHRHPHIGFIEKWYIVNPLAILGIALAYFRPSTKIPHAGHVLLSTWASLFHIIMAKAEALSFLSYLVIFVFLFLAVWLPCCVSDIVFPLLFVKKDKKI